MLAGLFGNAARDDGPAETFVIVPMPPLAQVLAQLEASKGAPLTETEVLGARNSAVCVRVSLSRARDLCEQHGIDDIDPFDAWQEWQSRRGDVHAAV